MSKGNRRERQAREIYEDSGYATQSFRGTRYAESDGFGLFDFVVLGNGQIRFVQVKSNRPRGYQEWFEDVLDLAGPAEMYADYLVCYDNEGWRLIGTNPDLEPTTFVDEREVDCAMGEKLTEYLEKQTDD